MPESKQVTLSEVKSKQLLAKYGVPFSTEIEVTSANEAVAAASEIGFPVAIKICADAISHKSERGMVKLNIRTSTEVHEACAALLDQVRPEDGKASLLVAKMESGRRELIAGVVGDEQFGSFVMLGMGGVFAEVLDDSSFAPTPLDLQSAFRLIDQLRSQTVLGEFRGEHAVDRRQLAEVLVSLSRAQVENESVRSIDLNPLIVRPNGSIVAVDALVEMHETNLTVRDSRSATQITRRHYDALFAPKGVVVVGASTHPGKFGFVSLHNILVNGYLGKVFATHLERATVLDIDCLSAVDDLPDDSVDLAFICTPASTNADILRACAKKGIKAAYITSAGYADLGAEGLQAQIDLTNLAEELEILVVGPNGQGLISTPQNLCAQIVGPYPPHGSISLVSQSGNFVSSFMNYARQTGVGVARAVSAGNAAMVGVPEFFDFFSSDESTKVALAYIEGVTDGRLLANSMRNLCSAKPLVVVKGGSTAGGARAASSHTGALASDDKIFDAVCRSTGVTRVNDVERAFDVAATFATQPLPKGKKTIVLTTIGGWGVVTSDAIHEEGALSLIDLPDHLESEISKLLPQRWSKNNPIDCAGGETRETVIDIMRLVATDEAVDAIIFLGIGIQSNQARMMREGRYFPDYELERIVNYHERQDATYANFAADLSVETKKPILVATELAVADPKNAGVVAVQKTGRLCYASGQRAARALSSVYLYAKWRGLAE
ncbi:MAG: acetate--CoA ligase family protein [Acidimicrobiaceae bacterium]